MDRFRRGCCSKSNKQASAKKGIITRYHLDPMRSFPHVTVMQFELESYEDDPPNFLSHMHQDAKLEKIWSVMLRVWHEVLCDAELDNKLLECSLPGVVGYNDVNSGYFSGYTWAKLSIDRDKNRVLTTLHQKVVSELEKMGLKCLNKKYALYEPHITLFNAETSTFRNKDKLSNISEKIAIKLRQIQLVPALGKANDQWEFLGSIIPSYH